MSIEKGRAYFRSLGMEERVIEFTVSSATVELAAQALGVDGARIAKTLSFKNKEGDGCILILAAGDARIDNRKFKDKFGMKAKMPSPEEVLEMVGHPVGGVCPFGCNDGIPVYLDESLKRFTTVFPAVGSPSSAIELNLDELYRCSRALEWIDVCKLPEEPHG
ncbi:MAG: YbaK/EbsC family protein [Oscillospiraceae bacterium]|nr:YbaK/EbsC family protein [Oscillospiraceae bacterium]